MIKKDDYVDLLHCDRKEAIRALANRVFDNHEPGEMRTYWSELHTGEHTWLRFGTMSYAELLELAGEVFGWDESDGSCSVCSGRGWLVMDENHTGKLVIQRCNSCEALVSDNAAVEYVDKLAVDALE